LDAFFPGVKFTIGVVNLTSGSDCKGIEDSATCAAVIGDVVAAEEAVFADEQGRAHFRDV